jgi:membrane protease YdiL (CAAX protease family)
VTTGVAAATAWWVPVALGALSGPGEEPGWRGFVLPRLLERHARLAATLRVAAVWIPWHLPMFLYRADFGPGAFVAFSLALLCGAIWLTEIHIAAGGSPFAAIAWHAVWNALAITARALEPSIFPVMTLGVLAGAGLVLWRWRRTASGRP